MKETLEKPMDEYEKQFVLSVAWIFLGVLQMLRGGAANDEATVVFGVGAIFVGVFNLLRAAIFGLEAYAALRKAGTLYVILAVQGGGGFAAGLILTIFLGPWSGLAAFISIVVVVELIAAYIYF